MKTFFKTLTTQQKVGYVLATLLSTLLLLPATLKIISSPMFVELFTAHNIGEFLTIIGLGLAVSSILYAIPRTKMIGTLLLSAYFGGTIVFHMTANEPFIIQSVILVLVWFLTWLRDQNAFWSKRGSEQVSI
jgi:hypothetical protein